MLNINDLEKRHKAYRVKNYMPYIVIFISLLIILFVIIFIKNSDIFMSNEVKNNRLSIETKVEPTKQELILAPSLGFISNIKHNSLSSEVNYHEIVKKEQHNKKEDKKPKEETHLRAAKKEPKPVVIEEVKLQRATPIKIQRQNEQDDIDHVIKRFTKNNNPALSLFIAKKYYEMQDYHQSYNYALITNKINDNIDASWIIFAKSLVKLDKKSEAINTLERYIQHSDSTQAKTLLEEIQRGKFK